MSRIVFTEKGFEDYEYWLRKDLKKIKRINQLLKSIERDGDLQGLGKPELLKYEDGVYSRRIDEVNRMVYEIENNGDVVVKACKGHYED